MSTRHRVGFAPLAGPKNILLNAPTQKNTNCSPHTQLHISHSLSFTTQTKSSAELTGVGLEDEALERGAERKVLQRRELCDLVVAQPQLLQLLLAACKVNAKLSTLRTATAIVQAAASVLAFSAAQVITERRDCLPLDRAPLPAERAHSLLPQ